MLERGKPLGDLPEIRALLNQSYPEIAATPSALSLLLAVSRELLAKVDAAAPGPSAATGWEPAVKLDNGTPQELRLLAIETRYRANDFGAYSDEQEWQSRAGQLDRAADLLSQAAKLIETALPDGDES